MKQLSIISAVASLLLLVACSSKTVSIEVASPDSPRLSYGAERLFNALDESEKYTPLASNPDIVVHIGCWSDDAFRNGIKDAGIKVDEELISKAEGFALLRSGSDIWVCGADESGALYGCMELCDRLENGSSLPREQAFYDSPDMVLRGTCIGVQKTYYLPGRKVYEYPYTQENFPWFYDKELWIKYLDMMVENRMNSLYLWNGHPFASLVKLPDYPYAVEVSDEDFERNIEIFSFLTEEANKRGIWVIQMFYNIIVSKPFAEHHGIPTQDRNVKITPLLSDYTRKSVAAFIENYPNVGLLVCLGEAMNTQEDDVEWFTKTIIPGVKDGLKALGKEIEPPIVLRAHDTNCKMVMDAALPIYHNLYTMNKYNGESLCTYEPRGPWTATHQSLSALGSVHIENVHILANLEPFRYGSPAFIRKSVNAMHEVHGANGLHLYPQASYWDWPYSADKLPNGERLLEMDRDWIWYRAWGRYAWDDHRPLDGEKDYWCGLLSEKYGCSRADAARILEAYDESGEISPKLLRKFGITEGNRETFLLGMFMSQLVNPTRWTVYPAFAESCGPVGEKLEVWAEKEFKGEPHEGEYPPKMAAEVREHARKALKAIEAVKSVREDREEFERLRNDIRCYEAFAMSFCDKIEAAMEVLMYKYDGDISRLDKAYAKMESSLVHYRRLVEYGDSHYLYANSMQTQQRRIPASGANAGNKLWSELLPQYEAELAAFGNNIEALKGNGGVASVASKPFVPAKVRNLKVDAGGRGLRGNTSNVNEWVPVAEGSAPYYDNASEVSAFAPEIANLQILKTNTLVQRDVNTTVEFDSDGPVWLWVGYYQPISPSNRYMPEPKLETDATADDYSQADIQLAGALQMNGQPVVNLHHFVFNKAGHHKLTVGHGMCLILGFSEPDPDFKSRDAGLKEVSAIDWLFY
ncbi:MAG: hypothetical protein IJU27_00285 [Bacteroidales bacterium]|nr:hypothetical protein [Bacteroidales bacterium]